MADQTQQFNEHTPSTDVVKHFSPNVKTSALQEVEDDAVYIQSKRFAEQLEENQRTREKAEKKAK